MRIIFIVCLLAVSLMSDARKIKDVIQLYGGRESAIEVVCIDYAVDATTLTFRTTKNCTPTLKVGHGVYIVDDNGQRHHPISTNGIKLDSLYVMVKGQSLRFAVSFDPVDIDNELLDMRIPNVVSMYGLHDRKIPVIIPKAEQSVDSDEYSLLQSGDGGFVEIEGMFHSSENVEGQLLYFQYNTICSRYDADKYAMVDDGGHFKLRFWMDVPRSVVVNKGGGLLVKPLGRLYLRPGDKIQLDVYDTDEGYAMSSRSLIGRKTYDKYSNIGRCLTFMNALDYQKNFRSGMTYMGYDDHYSDLWNCYKADSAFTNYLCWHNKLSPFETHLQFALFREMYLYDFLSLDMAVKSLYLRLKYEKEDAVYSGFGDLFDSSDTVRFLQYMDRMDYAYLKLLDPDDLIYMTIGTFDTDASMMGGLELLAQCNGMIAKGDKNRWVKIIEQQSKELNRIAGWSGLTFVQQMITVFDYTRIFDGSHADEVQYQQVRALLTNPYCKKLLDCRHQQMLERAKTMENAW